MLQNLQHKKHFKKSSYPAIIVENSIWGKEALENINLALGSKGIQNQEGFIINRGEKIFKKYFSTIKANAHDSIIMVLNYQRHNKVSHIWEKNILKSLLFLIGGLMEFLFKPQKTVCFKIMI